MILNLTGHKESPEEGLYRALSIVNIPSSDLYLKLGPEFEMKNTWPALSRNIREIQHNNAHNLSFEENHRFAYNMVLNRQGELLYKGLGELVVEHLNELADEYIIPAFPINPEQQTHEGEVLLKALRKVWDDHTSSMTKIGQILKYMVSSVAQIHTTRPDQTNLTGPCLRQKC